MGTVAGRYLTKHRKEKKKHEVSEYIEMANNKQNIYNFLRNGQLRA